MSIDVDCLASSYRNVLDFLKQEGLDADALARFHYTFKGEQLSFPMKLYDKELTAKKIQALAVSQSTIDVRLLTERYGFSTRWVQKVLKEVSNKEIEEDILYSKE